MTQELKRLVLVSLLPTFADFIEDLNEDKAFRTDLKIKYKNLEVQIRKIDEMIMKDCSSETSEQQVNIQIAFRQWLNTAEN
jgi:hypothetical protein